VNRPLQGGDPTGHQGPDDDQPWYSSIVDTLKDISESSRHYELDRLAGPWIQASLYSDPLTDNYLKAGFDTPFATMEVGLQLSTRVEWGDPDAPRFDQSRAKVKSEPFSYYIDPTARQVGLYATTPPGKIFNTTI
jgi:hypothetical protein